MATKEKRVIWGSVLIALLLGGWLVGPAEAQGPFSAQIQRALRAIGLSGTAGGWTVPLRAPDGAVGAPSYSFTTDTNTGFYHTGSSNIDVAIGGARNFNFASNNFNIRTDNGTLTFGAAQDTSLGRGGAAGKLVLTGTTPFIQLGGTTNSFPALKQNLTNLDVRLADDSTYAAFNAGSVSANGNLTFATALRIGANVTTISGTAPSALSACGAGTAPTFVWTNGTAAFEILTGSSTPVATCTWTMPAVADKWVCDITDITTQSSSVFLQKMSASSTTSVTMTNYNTAGAATAVVASDHLLVKCLGG